MCPKNEGIVYISHNGSIEQCKIVEKDFGKDGQHLLYGLKSMDNYIATDDELYHSAEECAVKTKEKMTEKYAEYYQAFDSIETVILHILYASAQGLNLNDLELMALTNRTSEFLGKDMQMALIEYQNKMREVKDEEGNSENNPK
jgi:hypothetical protein